MTRKNNKFKFDPKKLGKGYVRKAHFKKMFKPRLKSDRGFWPTHQFIRSDDLTNELNVKNSLAPNGGINVHRIDDMITGIVSKEEELLRREKKGDKFDKADTIRIENYHKKRKALIQHDISSLQTIQGVVKSKPVTVEGRFYKKIKLLKMFLEKNNKKKIAHVWLKIQDDEDNLSEMDFDSNTKSEFQAILNDAQSKIDSYDMVDMQLNELSNFVTPLNITGFKKLEDFQVRVIQLIQQNEKKPIGKKTSILVKAPTSAGKTALAGYLFTKPGRFLVCVPTNALAWQLSAYISQIMKVNVPLVTDTFQSALKMSDLVNMIIKSRCVVGTPKELVDVIARPEFKDITYDYMMLDEIHMLGHKEGAEMEHIIKAFPETPVLALSATIGNEVELGKWIESCGRPKVEIVTYNKRFINLQRFRYNQKTKKIDRINALSMIGLEDYLSGEVINKSIIPTPQDAYSTYQKILTAYPDEDSIKHQEFFESNDRLSLDDILRFFNHHLKFMVKKVQENDETMIELIRSLQLNFFERQQVNLVDLLFTLKESDKCPAIVFHKNSSIVMEYAYNIHQDITKRESAKYPKMYSERHKHNKKFKQQQKKDDRDESMKRINDSSKDSDKLIARMEKKKAEAEKKDGVVEERVTEKDLFEPHPDFILNQHQYINKVIVESWEDRVNPNRDTFFPRNGDCYHWVLMLLYRGIGIYCKGLPDPYLRIVQQMANDKQLAVVLSDKELVFGVSMPFRTAVILDDDNLDSMEYHQMAGRAGRRGHDKEGNVVFVEQSSERIRELSVSVIPNVVGSEDCYHYGAKVAEKLSESTRWNRTSKSMLASYGEEDDDFFESIRFNIEEGGVWDYLNKIDNKHLLHLLWQFRQTDECLMLPLVLQHFENAFVSARSDNETDQISAAHYLLHFIEVRTAKGNVMPTHSMIEGEHKDFYQKMKDDKEGYCFEIADEIDGDVQQCIRENRCIDTKTVMEKHNLRQKISRFISKLRSIQHYYYHMGLVSSPSQGKYKNICKLLGKLFTRLKWIYHTSSKLSEK